MVGNYNDVVDIILTFASDDDLNELIAIYGNVIPYLVTGKKFKEHLDFNILVREKKMNFVRKKIEKLSRVYEFDVISDSLDYNDREYGFKIIYENTKVNFIPYSIVNDNFFSKHYHVNEEEKTVKLTIKKIKNITKNSIIKKIKFEGKSIRIVSPEFLLANLEIKSNKNMKVLDMLSNLSDESVLRLLRNKVSKMIVVKKEKKIKKIKFVYFIVPIIVVFIAVVIICIIKR